jgi:hypothetical protein
MRGGPAVIVRVKKRDRYVVISKVPLEDKRLSWKAKGLLAYLLSKPDQWTVMVTQLVNESTDGKDAVRTALLELQASGYLEGEPQRAENGRFAPTDLVVYEEPQSPKLITRPFPPDYEAAKRRPEPTTEEKRKATIAAIKRELRGKK